MDVVAVVVGVVVVVDVDGDVLDGLLCAPASFVVVAGAASVVVGVEVVVVVVVHRPPSNEAGVPSQFAHLRSLVAVAADLAYCPGLHSRIGLHPLFVFPGCGALDSYCPSTHSSMAPQIVS